MLEFREDNHEPGRAVVKRLEGHRFGLTAWRCCLFLALAVFAVAPFTPAAAASDALTTLLEQARADGLRIIIVEPGDTSPEAEGRAGPGFGQSVTELTGRLVQRFGEVIDAAPGQFSDLAAKVAALSPDRSAAWPLWVVLAAAIGLALGHLVFAFLRLSLTNWALTNRALTNRGPPETVSEAPSRQVRIRFITRAGAVALAGLIFEIVFGLLVPIIAFGNAAHTNAVISTVVEIAVVLRLALIFFDALLLPDHPAMRLVTIGDDAARRLHRYIRTGLLVEFALLVPALLLLEIEGLPRELKVLAAIAGIGGGVAVGCIVVSVNRRGLAQLFSGRRDGAPTPPAQNAWIAMIAYFVIAWLVSSMRMLLDLPNAFGLVGAPLAAMMIACLIRGAGIFLAEKFSHAQPVTQPSAGAGAAEGKAGTSDRSHWIDEMASKVA
ncbi:MAG: hypothetical protein IIC03_00885, partial [Proteobacteria bacterium]|nr:hypothetical protein [Pseudomonadota bacterium]